MPQFAVFFDDRVDFSIEMLHALDAAFAEDMACAQPPTARRLSAMLQELLDGQGRHKLLRIALGEGSFHHF